VPHILSLGTKRVWTILSPKARLFSVLQLSDHNTKRAQAMLVTSKLLEDLQSRDSFVPEVPERLGLQEYV
jgi:hypothetical protein